MKVCNRTAQGAKPGEGGQLPGHKVSNYIAALRHSIPGVSLISPPPHHDIYSIEDLAQLIYDLKCVNPSARVSVKLVSEFGVGTVAAGVAKADAHTVVIAGHDGGTAASPLSSIKHAGTPWELGLSETQQTLLLNGLRSRVKLQVDGQLKTGRDVVIAALLGADEFGFATTALIALGCILMRKCHLDTCPVGIATQNEELRKNFTGNPELVKNYMRFLAKDIREIISALGFRSLDEAIGQPQFLEVDESTRHWKNKNLDLKRILFRPLKITPPIDDQRSRDFDIPEIDKKIIEEIRNSEDVSVFERAFKIQTQDRSVGASISGYCSKNALVNKKKINVTFTGSAGQSFGAFLTSGITFSLRGEANDYLGKGLSGGEIILRPISQKVRPSNENWIAGNTLLYGATSGRVFIAGRAGERFAVRNSGCIAVVEGVGDHGCEYMTGGTVLILGHTGRNFAAGMSGGIAYVLDTERVFSRRLNHGMVDLEHPGSKDLKIINDLINEHIRKTESPYAQSIIDNWAEFSEQFVKVMPREYRKVLAQRGKRQSVEGQLL